MLRTMKPASNAAMSGGSFRLADGTERELAMLATDSYLDVDNDAGS